MASASRTELLGDAGSNKSHLASPARSLGKRCADAVSTFVQRAAVFPCRNRSELPYWSSFEDVPLAGGTCQCHGSSNYH